MTRQASLFETETKPAGWRAPTRGEHVCARCQGAAVYGWLGAWYCRPCAPADFLPKGRKA